MKFFTCALFLSLSPLSVQAQDPAAEETAAGAQLLVQRLFTEEMSLEALQELAKEANKAGVPRQNIIEAKLVWGLRHQDTAFLLKILPEIEIMATSFDPAIAAVLKNVEAVKSFISYIKALKAGEAKDEDGFKQSILEAIWLNHPIIVTILIAGTCLLALPQLRKVYFDYNLLHMQSPNLSSVKTTDKLVNSGQSLLFAAVIADSARQAVSLEQQITNLSAVGSVESMAGHLSEDQTSKLRLVGEIKQDLASLRFDPPDAHPVNIPELSLTLYSLYGYCGAALAEIGTNEPALNRQLTSLRGSLATLRKDMLAGNGPQQETTSRQLGLYQQALFNDLRETFEALKNQDDSGPLRAEDLPPALRHMFVGTTGKFLLQIYPKEDIWQRGNQEKFLQQLRAVDPKVTGTPVQLYEYTEVLKKSYEQAAWYSLAAIIVLVLIHFRNLSSVLLSLLPVGIGVVWLGGLMGFFGVPLNPANIMTLPLVIGIGVTNGIHILNRFAEEQHASILTRSTGKAVLVSGLTAIVGFGSLILAKDRGIYSLGCVMATGVAACMVAGLILLPALLNHVLRRRSTRSDLPK